MNGNNHTSKNRLQFTENCLITNDDFFPVFSVTVRALRSSLVNGQEALIVLMLTCPLQINYKIQKFSRMLFLI